MRAIDVLMDIELLSGPGKSDQVPARVLLPTGEVYDVVGTDYEADNEKGDVFYIRTELHE